MNNIDFNFIKTLNPDLKKISNSVILKNIEKHKKEKRILFLKDFTNKYKDFNIEYYKAFHKDLNKLNNYYLLYHFHNIGKKEKRIYSLNSFIKVNNINYNEFIKKYKVLISRYNFNNNLYKDKRINNLKIYLIISKKINIDNCTYIHENEKKYFFKIFGLVCKEYMDYNYYKNKYKDLCNLNNIQLISHFFNNGFYENRICSLNYEKDFFFDYKFYIDKYNDLKHLNTLDKAYNHYNKYGRIENRLINDKSVVKKNIVKDEKVKDEKVKDEKVKDEKVKDEKVKDEKVKDEKVKEDIININLDLKNLKCSIHVSESLKHLENRIKKIYNLQDYNDINKPCVFFGLYSQNDFNKIKVHKGAKYIIFGGSDFDDKLEDLTYKINFIKGLKKYKILAISKNMEERIKKYNIDTELIDFNLVDKNLFKKESKLGNKIYIYDGIRKKPDNSIIYNKKLIDEVKIRLPDFEYMHSTDLNCSYEKMPEIYKQCFIGLRLTKGDGNANTVQEFEAMNIPIIHNYSNYGIKWNNIDNIIDIIKKIDNKKIITLSDLKCINIENRKGYTDLINNKNGDSINETNFLKNIIENNLTLYFNNKLIKGSPNLKPEITVSRDKKYEEIILKKNVFLSSIPYNNSNGLYFITKSMIGAIRNKNSLLYPHVYDYTLFDEINKKKFFLQEQSINKEWYNWLSEEEVKKLKLKYFPENSFVICICGRIAINSYPKSLLEAIKQLRGQGHNIYLLVLAKLEVNPHRLTENLYKEISSYYWVKSFTVDKKNILNYFRFCDVLASTYRDYCNHVGGSNKIKEYLLCNKPILCSRGRERERELGKDYKGLYYCRTCDTVPPLCWTKEFLKNPNIYKSQYDKYYKNIDNNNFIKNEVNFIKGYLKSYIIKRTIVAVIPVYGRIPLLKYTIRRLYEKNNINHVIILGESKSEEECAFNEGAIFIKHKNKPLGRKWNSGCMYIKRFNPDALLFVGSSDWISNEWIDIAYNELKDNIGYVGKREFDMIDITKTQKKYCKWFGYVDERKNETIGIGRLVSKKLLEYINYKPFPDNKNNSMDYGMYLLCKKYNMDIKIINNNSIFLSISCDLWVNMHQFNMHYYSLVNETFYNKDRKGCINIKNINGKNMCDIHNIYGCSIEIDNYWSNRDLYKNGSLYKNKDIKILLEKFPEIENFYNDYLKLYNIS